jgi:hypothetical protein
MEQNLTVFSRETQTHWQRATGKKRKFKKATKKSFNFVEV